MRLTVTENERKKFWESKRGEECKRKKKLRDMRERENYNTVDEETQIGAIERGRERLTLRGD